MVWNITLQKHTVIEYGNSNRVNSNQATYRLQRMKIFLYGGKVTNQ